MLSVPVTVSFALSLAFFSSQWLPWRCHLLLMPIGITVYG
jgi:hypothetical protein